jgi:hypothetical protein
MGELVKKVVESLGMWEPSCDCYPPFAGTDEESILTLLTSRSNAQRQEIAEAFKTLFGRVRPYFIPR